MCEMEGPCSTIEWHTTLKNGCRKCTQQCNAHFDSKAFDSKAADMSVFALIVALLILFDAALKQYQKQSL